MRRQHNLLLELCAFSRTVASNALSTSSVRGSVKQLRAGSHTGAPSTQTFQKNLATAVPGALLMPRCPVHDRT